MLNYEVIPFLCLALVLVKLDFSFAENAIFLRKKHKLSIQDLLSGVMLKGGQKKAAAKAAADETQRKEKIEAATGVINAKFDDPMRQTTYKEVSGATKELNLRELGKMFTQASNNNLYGLARSGLLGGSVDAESGADLQTRFGEGQIRAQKAGMDSAAQLKIQDERARQNLLGLAQSGIDTGSAATMAANQMSAAADAARSSNNTAGLQGLFDGLSQAYLARQQTQATQPRGSYGGGFSNPFGANSYSGRIQ
jgi:hypothetical protein